MLFQKIPNIFLIEHLKGLYNKKKLSQKSLLVNDDF
jgi:hypothetical protein